jgi:hypothetical protein
MSIASLAALCFCAVWMAGPLLIERTLRNFLSLRPPAAEAWTSHPEPWLVSRCLRLGDSTSVLSFVDLDSVSACSWTSSVTSAAWIELGRLIHFIKSLGELIPRHFQVGDSGPIYTETVLGHPPVVEPLNTLSNFIFLWIMWRWWRRNREYGPYPVASWGLPIMFASFIGGTVYHATRSHEFWYLLDWIPIYILALGVAAFIWTRLYGTKRGISIFATLSLTLITLNAAAELRSSWEPVTLISLSYGSLVIANLLPLTLHARRPEAQGARRWLVAGGFIMASAIGFRQLDVHIAHHHIDVWPHGSHFMWHLLGGLAVNCMLEYLWRADWQPRRKESA